MNTSPGQSSDVARIPDEAIDTTVARAGIFSLVEPAAIADLAEQVHTVRFSAHESIYREGEPGDRLFVIATGKIKIGRRSADGRNHLLSVIGPSDTFGELSVFDNSPRTSSASALTEVKAVAMDRDVVRSWIVDRPEIADRLLRVLARRLRRTDNDMCDLIFTDVPGRVARQLLRLAQRFGVQENGAMRVDHGLTQDELAQLVGAARETVNKVLTDFAQRGWIVVDIRSILILESEALAQRIRV